MLGVLAAFAIGRHYGKKKAAREFEEYLEELEARGLVVYKNGDWYTIDGEWIET